MIMSYVSGKDSVVNVIRYLRGKHATLNILNTNDIEIKSKYSRKYL